MRMPSRIFRAIIVSNCYRRRHLGHKAVGMKYMMDMLLGFRNAVLFVAAITILAPVGATHADDDVPEPRILVTGQGRADVAPDMAILSLMVTREADTARAALDSNSSAMDNVITALESEGIEARDIQTSNFSIQPRYSRPNISSSAQHEAPRIVGYTVRNSLKVRVRDITALGAILDKSVTLGVNEGGNILFTNKDPSAAIEQARIRAVKEAVAKAHTLAKAAGVKTGRVLEISEQFAMPRPMPLARAEFAMVRSADSVPVASGENTYEVTVHVSIAIDQ